MENENTPNTPWTQLIRKRDKIINRFFSKIPKPLSYAIILVVVIFFIIRPVIGLMADVKAVIPWESNPGGTKLQEPLIYQAEPPSTDLNCYTESWVPFTENYWDGLTRFQVTNGVFSLPSIPRKIDTVALFKKSCKGGFEAQLKFIPITDFINLDLYYGSWFRWEVGGMDMKSVRLFKNTFGCSAMKDVVKVPGKTFLDNNEEIASNKPVLVRFNTYLTETGKVRTELYLDFYSKKTGELITNEGGFYHEFDVDLVCDTATNKVLNIEDDYERIGVGLVKSSSDSASPQIVLSEFKLDQK